MKQSSLNAAAVGTLQKIQEQMRDICGPHYDEYHRVTVQRGWSAITVPQRRPQAPAAAPAPVTAASAAGS